MSLVNLLIYICILGLIFYVLFWGLGKIGLPEPFNKVAIAILVLIIVLVLINLLTGFAPVGPVLSWRH